MEDSCQLAPRHPLWAPQRRFFRDSQAPNPFLPAFLLQLLTGRALGFFPSFTQRKSFLQFLLYRTAWTLVGPGWREPRTSSSSSLCVIPPSPGLEPAASTWVRRVGLRQGLGGHPLRSRSGWDKRVLCECVDECVQPLAPPPPPLSRPEPHFKAMASKLAAMRLAGRDVSCRPPQLAWRGAGSTVDAQDGL